METRRSRVSTSTGKGAVGRRTPSFDGCSISARVIDTPVYCLFARRVLVQTAGVLAFLPLRVIGGGCNSGMSQDAHCFALASVMVSPQSGAKTVTLMNVQIDMLLSF